MNLVILTGPMAVGKMTIGRALAEQTGLKLFHNHMTIEPIIKLFPYSSEEAKYLIGSFREAIIHTMLHSDMPGMIYTYVCDFNNAHDVNYMMDLVRKFEAQGAVVSIVELEADRDVLIERNKSPFRLEEKPSKRNVVTSEARMLEGLELLRLNSLEGEIDYPNYIRIDNTNLSVEEVSDRIVKRFNLNEA